MKRFLKELRLLKYMDWGMTALLFVLLLIGVLFVYSACYISVDHPMRSLYKRQFMWAVTGFACYAGFAAFDYRRLRKLSWWVYGLCIALLLLVLLVGTIISGAQRWLMLFGIGIQPSEFAKLATIIVLARKLSRPGISFIEFRSLLGVLAVAMLPMLLVLKQPDLGTAAVFIPIVFVMMFVAGVPLRNLGILVAAGVALIAIVLAIMFVPPKLGASDDTQAKIMGVVGLRPYHRDRLSAFFSPGKDPLGTGWNKMQSEIAVGSGGTWGKGFLKGTQNILGFLPRKVAPTDFIYSVISEETGFAGSLVVLALFGSVMALCVRTALAARDKMGRLFCVGVAALLFSHTFVNIAMTIGLLPITGLPLPLLSYGGSFMVVTMSALGIVQSISIRSRMLEHVW